MSGAGRGNPSASSSSAFGPCTSCKDPNHLRKDCPRLPCLRCKGTGHTVGFCTTPYGKVCFKCSAIGHYSMNCPNPVPGPRCSNCGGYGHLANGNPTCATTPSLPLCSACNQHHRQRDCQRADRPIQFSEWDGSADVCTQCGVKGHVFRDCLRKV